MRGDSFLSLMQAPLGRLGGQLAMTTMIPHGEVVNRSYPAFSNTRITRRVILLVAAAARIWPYNWRCQVEACRAGNRLRQWTLDKDHYQLTLSIPGTYIPSAPRRVTLINYPSFSLILSRQRFLHILPSPAFYSSVFSLRNSSSSFLSHYLILTFSPLSFVINTSSSSIHHQHYLILLLLSQTLLHHIPLLA